MELSGMTNMAVVSGNLFAMKKAMETQESLVLNLLEGTLAQIPSTLATESAPTTGVNLASDGELDIYI